MISRLRFQIDRHPVRLLPIMFAVTIAVGTAVLMIPGARTEDTDTSTVDALFTATSAVCVTGLVVVDTPTHWSAFGHGVIIVLIQLGGLGIMTSSALLGLLVSRRFGLRSRLAAQAEIKTLALGDVRTILVRAAIIALSVEAVLALALALRFRFGYGYGFGDAIWQGTFHSVSAFNSAGFSLFSDSFVGFAHDPYICLPLMVGVFVGGLGIPVLFEVVRRGHSPRWWSPHTKITLAGTTILLGAGFVLLLAFEWSNRLTLGPMSAADKLLPALFHSVMPRSGGLNSVDTGAMHSESHVVTVILMFIGAGPASTGGGIKVTTFFLLGFVIWAEVRGEPDVSAFRRRIPGTVIRQALSVALLGVAIVVTGTIALLVMSDFPLDQVLFESTSAAATVGLSTGITGELSRPAQLILVAMMFVGRIGPIAVASALALRGRHRRFRYPEGRPIVG